MKPAFARALVLVSLCYSAGPVLAQRVRNLDDTIEPQPAAEPKLKGIVHWKGANQALIEIPGRSGRPISAILRTGERTAACEVTGIDERKGIAQVASGRPRTTNELRLALRPGEAVAGRTFAFQGARLGQVKEVYQEICGRTVVASAALPEGAFHLMSGPNLSMLEAIALLDEKLAAKGIFTVPRGEKFVFLVSQQHLSLPGLLPEPPPPDARGDAELLPAGLIRFREADSKQVLEIYAELTGRSVLLPAALRGRKVSLRSQTPLTRAEAVWLVQGALLLADISLSPEGEEFAYAIPSSWSEPLPKFVRRASAGRSGLSGNSGRMSFVESDCEAILDAYAGILGRTALPVGPEVPGVKLTFHAQQPLDREEARFALEALAALNHLQFELVGDRQVKLVPLAPAPQ